MGMNQISSFEAKVANGNGEQTLSRDVFRLGRRFDFYRMLSFYFTTVGFYFSSMVCLLNCPDYGFFNNLVELQDLLRCDSKNKYFIFIRTFVKQLFNVEQINIMICFVLVFLA